MINNFLPERYSVMLKADKIKIGLICCDTCKSTCDLIHNTTEVDCLIPTNKKFAVRIMRRKLWKSKLYYEYKLWKPDIPVEHLPERLFEM